MAQYPQLYLTAETQRAQRENIFIKNLCGLCVSAVNYIKITEFLNFSYFYLLNLI